MHCCWNKHPDQINIQILIQYATHAEAMHLKLLFYFASLADAVVLDTCV